jgi:hypothetical protein
MVEWRIHNGDEPKVDCEVVKEIEYAFSRFCMETKGNIIHLFCNCLLSIHLRTC